MVKKTKKGTEDKLSDLHGLVTEKIIDMVKHSALNDYKALEVALKFLKDNNIKADMEFNESLQELEQSIKTKVNVSLLPFPTTAS
jgi:predicted type IV restriction endonuclease